MSLSLLFAVFLLLTGAKSPLSAKQFSGEELARRGVAVEIPVVETAGEESKRGRSREDVLSGVQLAFIGPFKCCV